MTASTHWNRRLVGLLAAAVLLGLPLTASAQKANPKQQSSSDPAFFPPPPEPPRLQFLASFSDDSILQGAGTKKKKFDLAAWITGAKEEEVGGSGYQNPYGVAARDGRVYVCDLAAKKVHFLDMRKKTSGTVKGKFSTPVNITIAPDGVRYICDTGQRIIMVYDANDQYLTSITNTEGWTPIDVAVDGDQLFVADVTGGRIHVLDRDGTPVRVFGKKGMEIEDLGAATNLDVGPDGLVYVTDTLTQTIKVFTKEGKFAAAIGGPGSVMGRFARPKGIAIDPHGHVYVADAQWSVAQIFRSDGRVLLTFGQSEQPEPYTMAMPAAVAIDRTSIEDFKSFIAPNFKAEYLVFVVSQYGKYKVGVYAFGRDERLPASKYEIDMEKVARAEAAAKARAEAEAAEAAAKKAAALPAAGGGAGK